MNSKDFMDLVHGSFKDRVKLCERKSHDYATDDCLSNFTRLAKICDQLRINVGKPYGTALFLIVLKIDRLCNLLWSGATPTNESLADTLNDMQNYIDLLRAILLEQGVSIGRK